MTLGARSKIHARGIRRAEMRKRACALRIEGKTLRQIGAELGCSHVQVHRLLMEAVSAPPANAEELRAVRVAELEGVARDMRAVIKVWRERARGAEPDSAPSLNAADLTIKALDKLACVIERITKVEGSAAPTKAELSADVRVEDGARDDVLSALAALAAKGAVGGSDPKPDG